MNKSQRELFIKAYGDHEQSLLKRSFFKVNNKQLSDDLVQNTFLKTWKYLVKTGKIDHMKSFLFHILNDLIVDEYRKKKTTHLSLEVLTQKGFQVAIDDSDRLFNIMDGKTAILLIPLLSDKYRDIVKMRYIEDMSLKEIAEATNQTNNTVSVQIHRGVEKLAVLFRIENTITKI